MVHILTLRQTGNSAGVTIPKDHLVLADALKDNGEVKPLNMLLEMDRPGQWTLKLLDGDLNGMEGVQVDRVGTGRSARQQDGHSWPEPEAEQ